MICPNCGSENVTVQQVQVSSKMSHNERGCLWAIGRFCLICCTFGLWLIIGKSKGGTKETFKYETRGTCQSCAHDWKIK